MPQKKYNIHGMLVTTDENQHVLRRQRIEEMLKKAEAKRDEIKTASAAEVLEANTLKVEADTRAHECDVRERDRLKNLEYVASEIAHYGREISALQKRIVAAEKKQNTLRTESVQEVEALRVLIIEARKRAEAASELVDRKYGRRLREAENEVERWRMKLVRIDLRKQTDESAQETAP